MSTAPGDTRGAAGSVRRALDRDSFATDIFAVLHRVSGE